MGDEYSEALSTLQSLQSAHPLSIIALSEPISLPPKHAPNGEEGPKRSSDVSADAFENPTPESLDADLTHYKELFSKLRFSYIEQVTKEKFLRAIVGDPPLIVEHQEIVDLEGQLVTAKAELQAQKKEVAQLVADLEQQGRELARRHEKITLETTQLSTLPASIASLQESISALRAVQTPTTSSNPSLNLSLPATLSLLSTQEAELAAVNRQIQTLQAALPRKTKELERAEAELRPLEMQRAGSVAAAEEARRRKEAGERGVGDELEERGRWYRGVEAGLREMLGVET
ncbi:MAG: hypothetical protein M1819_006364 [Sarea resinae]|nr:MAG: hypothetical protein M1819_006364 [Sarea resinae]